MLTGHSVPRNTTTTALLSFRSLSDRTLSAVSGRRKSPTLRAGVAAGFGVAFHERVEARLVYGNLAAVQALDLARVDIDANHMVAGVSETGTGHEAHIARAENSNAHLSF